MSICPVLSLQVIDSIVWAFRHTERNVAETGLNLLLEMLVSFQKSEFATQFHQTYFMQLVQEIFAVMTGARRQRKSSLAVPGDDTCSR
jgi:exportin-1